jgi:hypothetical protein
MIPVLPPHLKGSSLGGCLHRDSQDNLEGALSRSTDEVVAILNERGASVSAENLEFTISIRNRIEIADMNSWSGFSGFEGFRGRCGINSMDLDDFYV